MQRFLGTLLLLALSTSLLVALPDAPSTRNAENEAKSYLPETTVSSANLTAAAPLVFVSSNTDATIGVFDVSDVNNITMSSFPSEAADADGIFYNRTDDFLYQVNRTDNVVNVYTDVCTDSPTLLETSTSGFRNGREVAVFGNKLVVAQDANNNNAQNNKLVLYNTFPSGGVSFERAFNVSINLWGIHAEADALFAVVDNSNQIAIFNDFFNKPPGALSPDQTVAVEGLVRTHGITYLPDMDMMFLTDVGDAASATDGALIAISNWTTASADGMISMDEQGRASGAVSQLGNPVDIAVDKERGRVYVAERASEGGKLLGFKLPILTGGIAPVYSQLFPGASAVYFSDADDMFDACELSVDGGMVSLEDGNTETTIIVDGEADMLSFASTADPDLDEAEFTYVVTDADGMILGIPPGNTVDFDPAGIGACLVYGLSYTGELTIGMGDNLLAADQMLSDECFELSENFITVNRIPVPGSGIGQLFVSSNTQAVIGVLDIYADNTVVASTIPSEADDADGIYYDSDNDVLYQLNRTDNVINLYGNVSTSPMLIATSSSDFTNGREIAVSGDKLVVAQDANEGNGMQNRLVVYSITASSITYETAYDVDINLWGIHAEGDMLFAIVDNSSDVAVFNSFFDLSMESSLTADAIVTVEGLVRTHGITYNAGMDMMLLTDVGEASSPTDGALVMVPNWMDASADGMISMDEQGRASGGASQLGNPVDIALSKANGMVYVAERANGGGKVLGFKLPILTGGIAPAYSQLFSGASAVYFSGNDDMMMDDCDMIVDGGMVSLEAGGTETTIVVDGEADMLSFASTSDPMSMDAAFTYVVTDADGMILGIPPGNMVDFDPAGLGACLVYGLSYTGMLQIEAGDNLLMEDLMISDGCFELSSNWITVNRVADQDVIGEVFFSSNTQMVIATLDVLEDNSLVPGTIASVAGDADGIYYDRDNDVLYQLNRTDNVINLYGDVSTSPMLIATSSSDFSNGREIAVSGDKLVVAQDANEGNGMQNRLVVYTITPTTITYETAYDVSINLWGIHAEGDVLYAIVDNSSDLAIFNDFFSLPMESAVTPDATVTIEGMVRTHGLTYDAPSDMMLLTDVGEASSATDGALVMIPNFMMAIEDNMVSMAEQGRVSGGSSQLGNPVDVALDKANGRVYVAERANGGGKILVYKLPILTGGIAPVYSQSFAGASAVFFSPVMEDDMVVNDPEAEEESILDTNVSAEVNTELGVGMELDVNLAIQNVYPVPANDVLNVLLNSSTEQEITIGIFDVTGKLLIQQRADLNVGENLATFDVSDWPGGMYFLRIPSLNTTTKFVKK